MGQFLEICKNISVAVGCLAGIIGLATTICKPLRRSIASIISKYSGKAEVVDDIREIKEMISNQQKLIEEQMKEIADNRERVNDLIRRSDEERDIMQMHFDNDASHQVTVKKFMDEITTSTRVNENFTRMSCRQIITSTFYKYKHEACLPLYEWKTLKNIEDVYINQLNGNSFAHKLLEEMNKWDIDYESERNDG